VILKFHLYLGIAGFLLIVVLGLTGAVLAFEDELTNWLSRDLTHVQSTPQQALLGDILASAQKLYPGYRVIAVDMPVTDDRAVDLLLAPLKASDAPRLRIFADPHTGQLRGECGSRCSTLATIQKLHTSLMLKRPWSFVVGYATALLLFMAASGIYLWWKRKIFQLHRRHGFWRFNFDVHHALGFYLLPLVIVIAVTGILLMFQWPKSLLLKLNPPGKSEVRLDRPTSTVVAGARPLDIDSQVRAAVVAMPGMRVLSISPALRPKDPLMIMMSSPEEKAERVHVVFVDQFSGKVLRVWEPDQNPGLGTRILSYTLRLHTGRIAGWFGQVVMCLVSLSIAALAASGILIWIRRAFI